MMIPVNYKRLSIIVTLFSVIASLQCKNIEFYREDLTFTLTKSHLTVDGNYFFRNDTDKSGSYLLYYPYPGDSIMGYVDSTFALDSNNKLCKVSERKDGMTFSVKIAAHDTTVCRIGYRQSLNGHSARYILTTTQSWGKPFKEVSYSVISNLKHLKFNYKPDSIQKKGRGKMYRWHKTNFMPDKDFIIYF
jgi:hypothetical protein